MRELLRGSSAVADGIFLLDSHLCEADAASFWREDGVVAESFVAMALGEDFTFHDAFEEVLFSFI